MRSPWISLLVLAALSANPAHAQPDVGARTFQRCAACHLPDGRGVPRTFPPLDAHLARLATDPAGRQYLVMVLSKGLSGPLTVDGQTYLGVMPRQPIGAAETAAVLNHVLSTFAGPALPGGWVPFDEAEVARDRADVDHLSSAALAALRAAALK